MALIVEDGTGKSDAESYISVADADTYHTARGNTAWTSLSGDTVKEQALRKAADYMVQAYRQRWKGVRKSSTQALDWPRSGVLVEQVLDTANYVLPELDQINGYILPNNVVPDEVARANAELALRTLSTTLNPDLTRSDDVKREKVDVIEVEYKDTARPYPTFSAVDGMLTPFLRNGSAYGQGAISLIRG